jgi:hypothetical protein
VSVLRPESVALLRTVRVAGPLFPNLIVAELFDAAHTRGSLKVLPRTVGGYVLFDSEAPLNQGTLAEFKTLAEARECLARTAADNR